ncbi:MAG: histidine--tRNA ligase [Bacteroidota bacterium]
MSRDLVKPRPISGFPEFLPDEQITFDWARDLIRRHYESFGFTPIETPAVERTEVLLAKGGNDREIYGLRRLADDETPQRGDDPSDLALHFDLTVPLARYVAQNAGQLPFPFRRYQIQPVWRGERPQAGRYRQFYQADIDVIGDGALSLFNDAEMPAIISGIFAEMTIGPFTIRINNRKVLRGLLASIGLEANEAEAIRAFDRIDKIGRERTAQQLADLGGSDEGIASLLALADPGRGTDDWLEHLGTMSVNDLFAQGVNELRTVVEGVRAMGVPEDHFAVDPSLARGLDYYTGTIYETRLNDHLEVGSICGGGRYDNLAENYTTRQLPGVGISIGLTRMIPRLFEAGVLTPGRSTPARILVTLFGDEQWPHLLRLAAELREAGIPTEVYAEAKKLKQQLKYAARKGHDLVVIAGPNEVAAGTVNLKDMREGGGQQTVEVAQLTRVATEALSR